MRPFYSLSALLLLSSTTLFAGMPFLRSGMLSNAGNEKKMEAWQPEPAKTKEVHKQKKECGLCTIEKGTWAITPKFAVAPTWYTDRGDTLVIAQVPPTGLDSKDELKKFDDMFDLPLMYGGSVGYMFRKHVEFFLDFDYTHADGDTLHLHHHLTRIKQDFHAYKAFGAYIGTRLYAAFFKERFTPFIGIKVGYMHRWKVKIHETISTPAGHFKHSPTFFHADNTIAGGAGIGFDIYFTNWMAFSFETECLISGQRRSATLFSPSPAPIVRVGDTGALVSVPISFALKFKI